MQSAMLRPPGVKNRPKAVIEAERLAKASAGEPLRLPPPPLRL